MGFRPTKGNIYLLITAGLLAVTSLGLPLLWWEPTTDLALYLGLILLFTTLVGGLILYRWLRGQLDWFEPGVFVGVLYLVLMGYGGIRIVAQPELQHPMLQRDSGWIPLALLLVLLGVVAFWAGYYIKLGEKLHRLLRRPAQERLRAAGEIRPFWVVSIYLVGLSSRLYMTWTGIYGYLKTMDKLQGYFSQLAGAQVLTVLEVFCQYALVLAWLDHLSHPREPHRRLLAWGLLGSEVFWGFFSGFKGLMVIPIFLVIILYTYKKRRLPVEALGVIAILFVIVYPLNNVYRGLLASSDLYIKTPLDMVASIPVILKELFYQFDDPNLYFESGYQMALSRTTTSIQNFALLVRYLDATGAYWYGRDIILLPALILVPRFLWASKPLYDKGYWYAVNVWGSDPHVYNSIAYSFPGDLYLQFGLPSLLLGMFLFGVLLRLIYERYARPRSNYSLFFYVFLLYHLARPEADIAFRVAGTVKMVLVMFVLSLVAFRFPRQVLRLAPQPAAPAPAAMEPAAPRS